MSNELTWYEIPELRRPLLLIGFEGLFDAAEAATSALRWVRDRTESTEVAMVDPEGYYNFQESRPTVRIDDDGGRVIDWPVIEIHAVNTDSVRDLMIMTGAEPHLRWRTFADQVTEVARRTGCEMVVTVGAFVGMVPHTRPFSVTGSAVHPELIRRLNLSTPSYEGPTSLVGVINERLERANIPVISLRVEVPHYVPGPPNPKATRALLRRLQQTTGVVTGYEELDAEVTDWTSRVDQAVLADDESRDYVARLEQQADSTEAMLPSGDDLAGELEAFLRDQAAAKQAVLDAVSRADDADDGDDIDGTDDDTEATEDDTVDSEGETVDTKDETDQGRQWDNGRERDDPDDPSQDPGEEE